jgi:hypothetical protein
VNPWRRAPVRQPDIGTLEGSTSRGSDGGRLSAFRVMPSRSAQFRLLA